MKVLCTAPGKFGDILWALPTVRALAGAAGEPVDICLSKSYGAEPFRELIAGADYVGTVWVDPDWIITREGTPMQPRHPPRLDDSQGRIIELSYQRWPLNALPVDTYLSVVGQWGAELPKLDLQTPWLSINGPRQGPPHQIVVGFTDEWFELKVGLVRLLEQNLFPGEMTGYITCAPGSRWTTENAREADTWLEAAQRIADAQLFLGDCSALHILAYALGKSCILVEPSEARHNFIFWPFGMDGPRIRCVKGNDGKPTFDARHTVDALRGALNAS